MPSYEFSSPNVTGWVGRNYKSLPALKREKFTLARQSIILVAQVSLPASDCVASPVVGRPQLRPRHPFAAPATQESLPTRQINCLAQTRSSANGSTPESSRVDDAPAAARDSRCWTQSRARNSHIDRHRYRASSHPDGGGRQRPHRSKSPSTGNLCKVPRTLLPSCATSELPNGAATHRAILYPANDGPSIQ